MLAGARVDLGPLTRSESALAEKSEGNLKATVQSFTRIQKRSYKRALRRAQTEGSTMYRGRRLSRAVHLPCDSSVPGSVKPSNRSRLEVITWNVDGLSDILYAEIQALAKQHLYSGHSYVSGDSLELYRRMVRVGMEFLSFILW